MGGRRSSASIFEALKDSSFCFALIFPFLNFNTSIRTPAAVLRFLKTVGDFLRQQPTYSVELMASEIQCPTLITDGGGDFAWQNERLLDLLVCQKKLVHVSKFSKLADRKMACIMPARR